MSIGSMRARRLAHVVGFVAVGEDGRGSSVQGLDRRRHLGETGDLLDHGDGMPASLRCLAVPPVLMISMPNSSTRPARNRDAVCRRPDERRLILSNAWWESYRGELFQRRSLTEGLRERSGSVSRLGSAGWCAPAGSPSCGAGGSRPRGSCDVGATRNPPRERSRPTGGHIGSPFERSIDASLTVLLTAPATGRGPAPPQARDSPFSWDQGIWPSLCKTTIRSALARNVDPPEIPSRISRSASMRAGRAQAASGLLVFARLCGAPVGDCRPTVAASSEPIRIAGRVARPRSR